MSILLNYGFQKYLVKTPENENVPSEKISIHCATQETKPLMWLIFPRMIHKSKIKKNRFNGHLHLFFVDLKISYSYNIFLFREYYYQMWVWPPIWIIVLIASNSKNCKIRIQNRVLIISPQVDPRLPQLIWGYSLSCW